MNLDDSDDETLVLIDPWDDKGNSNSRTVPTVAVPASVRWRKILIGQVASVMLCLSGVATIFLTDYGLASPIVQNWLSYFLLSVVFSTWVAFSPPSSPSENFIDICKSRGWRYFLMSIVDTGASYFLVLAYQYTSLTSVQLLDCVTIPTTLVLSYVFLRTRYGYFHYVGIVLSLIGAGFLVWADVEAGMGIDGSDPIFGDILTLIGAILFGVSNVCQEFFVKNYSPYEYLGFVGFFGTVLSAILALIVEDFSLLNWTLMSVSVLFGFAISKFFFWTCVAYLLVDSDAVAMNLAVLSAGFYSIIVGTYLFGYEFNILAVLSFVLIIGGISIFSTRPISQDAKSGN